MDTPEEKPCCPVCDGLGEVPVSDDVIKPCEMCDGNGYVTSGEYQAFHKQQKYDDFHEKFTD